MEMDFDQILIANCQQTVAPKMLHKVVVDGVFIQIMPLNEQLGGLGEPFHNNLPFKFTGLPCFKVA